MTKTSVLMKGDRKRSDRDTTMSRDGSIKEFPPYLGFCVTCIEMRTRRESRRVSAATKYFKVHDASMEQMKTATKTSLDGLTCGRFHIDPCFLVVVVT